MNTSDLQSLISKWNPHFVNATQGRWQHTTRREWYLDQITKTFAMRHIVVLTGVRRCGKSVILHQLMERLISAGVAPSNVVYLNLEDIQIEKHLVEESKQRDAFVVGAELLENLYQTYRATYNPQGKIYLFLDEIQGIPACNHVLNTWYESQENMKVFVSGSHRSLDTSQSATLLTGRTIQFSIRPLDFSEYLKIHGVQWHQHADQETIWLNNNTKASVFLHHLYNYLVEGGFPEIVLAQTESEKQLIAQSYYRSFLSRDIIAAHQLRNPRDIEVLGLRILADFAKTHTFRKLGAPLRMAPDSVKTYLEYFYDAYIFTDAPFFSYSTKHVHDVSKPKKIYAVDNGLRNFNVLRFSPDLGRNAENVVFNELNSKHAGVFYWSDVHEVDFVVANGDTALFNCSYTDDIPAREAQGLVEAMHHFELAESVLITKNTYQETVTDGKKIAYVPLWVWLLQQGMSGVAV